MPDAIPLVICIRDPDYDNEFMVFGEANIYDIDLGRSNLRDPEEYAMWAESHGESADQLEAEGNIEAANFIREIVNNMNPEEG